MNTQKKGKIIGKQPKVENIRRGYNIIGGNRNKKKNSSWKLNQDLPMKKN